MTDAQAFFQALAHTPIPDQRPLVIQAWAQSLNGSVARADGTPLTLSSEASMRLTHRLRAFCDGILVGIGSILTDDPRLTARGVEGPSPQPIVLDTHLRFPDHARLLEHPLPPWLLTGPQPPPHRLTALTHQGATIIPVPLQAGRVHLAQALRILRQRGIRTLMVEGGPTVHTALLQAGLTDWLAITISPSLLAGRPALNPTPAMPHPLPLVAWHHTTLGPDFFIWGKITA